MAIEWKNEYSVNVKEIDDQHKHFIDLMNRAYGAFYKTESKEEIGRLIEEILSHAMFHFGTEEKYFDKFQYEFSEEHKEEHRQLVENAAAIKNRFAGGNFDAVPALVDFLENWLVSHISIHDKKYIKCFNDHGLF